MHVCFVFVLFGFYNFQLRWWRMTFGVLLGIIPAGGGAWVDHRYSVSQLDCFFTCRTIHSSQTVFESIVIKDKRSRVSIYTEILFSNATLFKFVFHKNGSRYLTYILPEPVWLLFANIFNEIIHPWRIIGSAHSICLKSTFFTRKSILAKIVDFISI